MADDFCIVTGVLRHPNIGEPEMGLATNKLIQVVQVIKSGRLYYLTPIRVISDKDTAEFSFTLPQNSTAYFYSNVTGLKENGLAGVPYAIPEADTVTLEDLVSVASVPSTGIVAYDETTLLDGPFGTVKFAGSGVSAAKSAPGVLTVTIPGGASSVMTTLGDTVYGGAGGVITKLAGNTTATRKFLRQIGDGSLSAAPAWDVLSAADLPTGIDAAKISSGGVSNAEFAFLDGASSNLQTQINGKAAISHTHIITDTTGLQAALDAKLTQAAADSLYASLSHNHSGVYEPVLGFIAVPNTRTVNGHALSGNISVTPTDLGLVIGMNVQAWDADLDSIAALTPTNDDVIQRKAGAWVNRSISQLKTDLNYQFSQLGGNLATSQMPAGGTWSLGSDLSISAGLHYVDSSAGGFFYGDAGTYGGYVGDLPWRDVQYFTVAKQIGAENPDLDYLFNAILQMNDPAAGSGFGQAISAQVTAKWDGDGSGATIFGADFFAYLDGSGSLGIAAGFDAKAAIKGSGTINETYGVRIASAEKDAGTINTNYGMRVLDQTAGTTNYAIRTGAGQVLFGDAVTVSGVLKTGSTPITLTDSSGKLTSSAFNTGAAVANATDNASAILRLNEVLSRLRALGLIAP